MCQSCHCHKLFVMVLSIVLYFQVLDNISGVFQLSCGQFIWMGICALCSMLYTKNPPKLIQKSNIVTMVVFISSNLLFGILIIIASLHIPVGTLDAIQILSFIVASFIFSLIRSHFAKEEYQMIAIIIDVITVILMFFGVIFLVQPSELFGTTFIHPNSTGYSSLCNSNRFTNTTVSNATASHYAATEMYKSTRWIGYLCAFLDGIVNVVTVASGKRLQKDEDVNSVLFWQSLWSSIVCLIIVNFQRGFIFPSKIICLVFLFLHGVTGGIACYFFFTGMCYISSVDVAVIGACILPLLFISQLVFLREISPTPTNNAAIIAAVAVVVIVIVKPLLQSFLAKKGLMRLSGT